MKLNHPHVTDLFHARRGFTRSELLGITSALCLLALIAIPVLARSREPGKRALCENNLRQIDAALLMFSTENGGVFPPRRIPNSWPETLKTYYSDLRTLHCPSDAPNAGTSVHSSSYPADSAPRSYVFNGWNDYFAAMGVLPGGRSMPESAIASPGQTVTFGEKYTDSGHFYLSLDESGFSDLEQSRHSCVDDETSGGSNFAFADGSVRFLGDGGSTTPINLWATDAAWRTNSVTP